MCRLQAASATASAVCVFVGEKWPMNYIELWQKQRCQQRRQHHHHQLSSVICFAYVVVVVVAAPLVASEMQKVLKSNLEII